MKKPTQLFPYRFRGIQCDIYGCSGRSAWVVGRPDGPLSETFKLCPGCTDQLLTNVPDELKQQPEAEKQPQPKEQAAPTKESVVVTPVITDEFKRAELSKLTYKDLKKLASEYKIPGYTNMNKEELVQSLIDNQKEPTND